ncbi:T9SS type B sorting domain-containing protein [Lacihabitans lacunae]|uniref:Gliding motility-associated C-terminal domain-containing protein n=1 Tax=Lacihabitans lacunae TaxID=1028214 RepID=A0ABV7Z222_9BACT
MKLNLPVNMYRLAIDLFSIFCFTNFSLSAQGLCDRTDLLKGNFDTNTDQICQSSSLVVTDKSGASELKYIFDYQGQSLEDALGIAQNQTSHIFPALTNPKSYTVLQLGKRNGNTTVACKNIIVRPNNTPLHSYSVCQSTVDFSIPLNPINDFDSYVLEFGSGQPPIFFSKAQLPFSVQKTFNLPQSYKVTGRYTDPSKNCSLNYGFQTIPLRNPNIELPFTPQISKVELITLKNVKIDYNGPFVPDPQFNLYRYEKEQYQSATPIKTGILPGIYTFDIPDSTKSYCFFVRRNTTCGGQIVESAEVCTIPIISTKFDPQNAKNDISWIAYQKTLKSRTVPPLGTAAQATMSLKQKLIINKLDTPNQIGEVELTTNTFMHGPLDCFTKYTYQVWQEINGTTNFTKFRGLSISNKVSFDPQLIVPPAPTNLWVNTEVFNQIYYKENLSEWPIEQNKWYLLKLQENTYKVLDSSFVKNSFFTDNTTPIKQETYKIAYKDKCDRLSQYSEPVNSIFLSINDLAEINWTQDTPFGNSNTSGYQLIYQAEGTENTIDTFPKEKSASNLDLDKFSSDGKLKIVAESNNSSYPSVASNSVDLNLPFKLFIPTIFTPNNDGINDLMEIKTLKSKIRSFEMKIFDRLGNEISNTDEIESRWDGKANGKNVPTGNYQYQITLTLTNNTTSIHKGNIYVVNN